MRVSLVRWLATNKRTLTRIVDRGQRALASCLGGGDLDGDDFNLIRDVSPKILNHTACLSILQPKLLPTHYGQPGEYQALPIKRTENPCDISDVVDFVFDYASLFRTFNACKINYEM
jgi:hypothetical protein